MNIRQWISLNSVGTQIITVLLMYVGLHSLIVENLILRIPNGVFDGEIFILSALSYWPYTFTLFGITVYFLYNYQRLTWNNFENGSLLKTFLFILMFAIFWEQTFYDYNFYLDTDFLIDKVLLVSFALLVLVHPLFVFAFVLLFHIKTCCVCT